MLVQECARHNTRCKLYYCRSTNFISTGKMPVPTDTVSKRQSRSIPPEGYRTGKERFRGRAKIAKLLRLLWPLITYD
jgi:hypothetical protein